MGHDPLLENAAVYRKHRLILLAETKNYTVLRRETAKNFEEGTGTSNKNCGTGHQEISGARP